MNGRFRTQPVETKEFMYGHPLKSFPMKNFKMNLGEGEGAGSSKPCVSAYAPKLAIQFCNNAGKQPSTSTAQAISSSTACVTGCALMGASSAADIT
jgi:hypothetical protein